jgi:hypothetical protein
LEENEGDAGEIQPAAEANLKNIQAACFNINI